MEPYYEWKIEVDENRQQINLAAQENFIVEFIGSLYTDMEQGHEELTKIKSMHFSRIFEPRSDIGSYVRLRIFAEGTNWSAIDKEMENRLSQAKAKRLVFQVQKKKGNWEDMGEDYGGPELALVFRDYLDCISRIAYRLLSKKQEGVDEDKVEKALWSWTHMYFNAVRGYGRSVIEFAQGAVTGFIGNV